MPRRKLPDMAESVPSGSLAAITRGDSAAI